MREKDKARIEKMSGKARDARASFSSRMKTAKERAKAGMKKVGRKIEDAGQRAKSKAKSRRRR